jgi:hypothetical protein
MRIINVPIESLEERYSAQWNKWFPEAFTDMRINFVNIYPDTLSDHIKDGSFLDVCGTNYFKAGQLKILTKMLFQDEIEKDDVIFFHDLWCPGIEMLQYIRQGKKLNFKICGILHAGTYDPYDFLAKQGMASWGGPLEEVWFSFIDQIYVATEFHKNLIWHKRKIDFDKIKVTGLPIYNNQYPDMMRKENIVVFPHRLDSEKNPQLFDRLSIDATTEGWQFIKTKEVCKTKKDYFKLLNRAKIAVSFADQETWGIAQQEALFAKCFPVVPNRLSYSEMYRRSFRYSSFEEAVHLVKKLMEPNSEDFDQLSYNRDELLRRGDLAILNIVNEMEKL